MRREHFGALYDEIFTPDLSAAQLIIAVLILRFAESKRYRATEEDPEFIPYASHFIAMRMGRHLLSDLHQPLARLDHRVFEAARSLFEKNSEAYHQKALTEIKDALNHLYATKPSLQLLSATFRRGDLIETLNQAGST